MRRQPACRERFQRTPVAVTLQNRGLQEAGLLRQGLLPVGQIRGGQRADLGRFILPCQERLHPFDGRRKVVRFTSTEPEGHNPHQADVIVEQPTPARA